MSSVEGLLGRVPEREASVPEFRRAPSIGAHDGQDLLMSPISARATVPLFAMIEYEDAAGLCSRRRITVQAVGGGYVEAYCHERRAPRTFRADRIQAVIDEDGVSHEPDEYWRSVGVNPDAGTTPSGQDLMSTFREALTVLVAVGRSDGRLVAAEREAILDYVQDEARRRRIVGAGAARFWLETLISRLRPTRDAVRKAFEACLSDSDKARVQRLIDAIEKVVAADGKIAEGERDFAASLHSWSAERATRIG